MQGGGERGRSGRAAPGRARGLFAVGVLLLIVAGGGIWLLTGAVQGISALMHG